MACRWKRAITVLGCHEVVRTVLELFHRTRNNHSVSLWTQSVSADELSEIHARRPRLSRFIQELAEKATSRLWLVQQRLISATYIPGVEDGCGDEHTGGTLVDIATLE